MKPTSAHTPGLRDAARRRFLKRGVQLGAALAAGVARSAEGQSTPAPVPDDPSRVLGNPMRPYGDRSRFVRLLTEQVRVADLVASVSSAP